ncbi:MAG TPA: hypothetical protein VKA68_10495 [bacterium]|nr:hypothetical protein [bacterium]
MLNKSRIIKWGLYCAVVVLFFRCEESLPPYGPPADVVRVTKLQAVTATEQLTDPEGRIRSYVIFLIDGINNYDDTLQDTAAVTGRLHVWFDADPSWTATLPLTNADISEPTDYSNGVLTLDPQEQFHLHTEWNLLSDDGTDILHELTSVDTVQQTGLVYAAPETLRFQVELSLFSQVEETVSDTQKYGFTGYYQLPPE